MAVVNDSFQIATQFYQAMDKRDSKTIETLYDNEAHFSDPVFPSLTGSEAGAMWTMLLKGAKEFSVSHTVLKSEKDYAEVQWIAKYNFSKTGRPVVNQINTQMHFKNGLIIRQKDVFSMYEWAKQALGFPGYLLGWSSFMQSKIQAQAKSNLEKHLKSNGG